LYKKSRVTALNIIPLCAYRFGKMPNLLPSSLLSKGEQIALALSQAVRVSNIDIA
jgi:hypothetical protein